MIFWLKMLQNWPKKPFSWKIKVLEVHAQTQFTSFAKNGSLLLGETIEQELVCDHWFQVETIFGDGNSPSKREENAL